MTFAQTAIVVVLAATLVLFISERVRYDLVALGALLACVLLGLVEPGAAFTGFANDAVITVAAVLVMSHALARSGAVDAVTAPLLRVAAHPIALLAGLCVIGALLSSFMNNVGALALLMPIAIAGARTGGYSVALLLMPLSFATLLGGTTTLIGTPPNLLMADLAERLRGEPFSMFEFTPVGAAITVAGILFMVTIGWRFLPRVREGAKSSTELFDIGHYVTEARLPPKSGFIGKTIREFEDSSGDRAIVLGLVHGDTRLRPRSSYVLQDGDVLLLQAETEALQEFVKAAHIDLVAAAPNDRPDLPSAEAAVPVPAEAAAKAAKTEPRPAARLLETTEAVVTPTSWVQGSTARTLRLRARYDANLLAISRRGRPIATRLRDVALFAGDVLLLEGPSGDLPDIITKLGCLPLADRKLILSPRRVLLPFAVFIGAVALVMLGVTSAAIAFVLGAAAMVGLGFLPAREVYSTIEWPVIVLLAALIPVAGALETTGTAQLAADVLVARAGNLPPHVILGIVLVATMAITPILNNAATVLLMGPIAHGVAQNIGVDSAAFLMAVAIGASCDFLTPFGHQNNTLILGPGGYRFADFWKVGLPIDAIILLVAVPLLPIVFPFA
ncbi:MAG TPA: SLC13 family permease [Gammaproteobacteria bacterium]|nr:SLC13 family permease [Gammaproteobacteria bacterium]